MYNPFKRVNTKLAKNSRRKTVSAITDLWKIVLFPETPKILKSRVSKSRPKASKVRQQSKLSNKSVTPDTSRSRLTTPRGAEFKTGFYVCEHGERTYKLYIPSVEKKAINPLPLLVMLHGCNQTSDDFARGTGMNVLAEEFGFYVLYPNQGRKSQTYRCWNWYKRSDQARGLGEPALISSLTRQVIDEYKVDAAKVYIAGLSAGASIALITANAYPDVFSAVGTHSGLPAGSAYDANSAVVAMRYGMLGKRHSVPLPTIIFHGEDDNLVNPRNSEYVADRASEPYSQLRKTQKIGYASGGQKYIRTSYRLGRGRSFVERWLVVGAGHAWSGGNNAGSYTNPSGPDASREMVRFFLRHRTTKKWRSSFQD